MAKQRATFSLDRDLLRATRVRAARTDRRDSDVVEEALRAYLGWDVVESVWARSELSGDEAMELAVAEVRAHRADPNAARRS
jgi:Arc/MetJ family transcription regulator